MSARARSSSSSGIQAQAARSGCARRPRDVAEGRQPRHRSRASSATRPSAGRASSSASPLVVTIVAVVEAPGVPPRSVGVQLRQARLEGARSSGAGEWSAKADRRSSAGKMNIAGALMLADTPEQVAAVKEQILANDATDPQGALIAEVTTVDDFLPGTRRGAEGRSSTCSSAFAIASRRACLARHDRRRAKTLREMKPPEDLTRPRAERPPAAAPRRFEENNGTLGTVFYVKYKYDVSLSDGHNLLRMAKTTDNVPRPTARASRPRAASTIFAEMIRSMERDGPLATGVSFVAVMLVVILATSSKRGCVLASSLSLAHGRHVDGRLGARSAACGSTS